jgi:hypothetical protein
MCDCVAYLFLNSVFIDNHIWSICFSSILWSQVYKGSLADKVGVRLGDSISYVSVNRKKYEFCGLQEVLCVIV